jgi:hypothetical protein
VRTGQEAAAEQALKQSGLGVASALLFVLSCSLVALDLNAAAAFAPLHTRLAVIIPMMCLSFVGLVLGIVAWTRRGRRKTYAVLGTCFNLLPLGWGILLLQLLRS